MNIVESFLQQVRERPDAIAIVHTRRGASRTISFADLDLASRRAAAMLHEAGLEAGDAVLILQSMSIELYVALIAIFRLGLIATVFDPSAGRAHIERCCTTFPPKAFIGSSKAHLLRLCSGSIRRIPHKFVIGSGVPGAVPWKRADSHRPYDELHPCEQDTPALLTFTSGSTGIPKASMRSHGFLLAQHDSLVDSLELRAGEIDLTTLPIFALANLGSGVTSVIPDADLRSPGRIDPGPVLEQIAQWSPTRTGASPSFLERLADECLRRKQPLPSIQSIYLGGAPVFPRLMRKLESIAPNAMVAPVYGSTEAEPIAHVSVAAISADDLAAMAAGKGLLAGTPVSSIRLRILRQQTGSPLGPYTQAEFDDACLPVGEPGEIVVSGRHVLPGYLNGQGDSETKFRVDGAVWHRTEDAGYLDAQGRLWLLGRCCARIEDLRGVLYPFAVECAAMNHPAVRRAAVAAHSDRRILVLEASDASRGLDLAAVADALMWAMLDRILIVKSIPVDKRHNAKVDYPALHRLIEHGRYVSRRDL